MKKQLKTLLLINSAAYWGVYLIKTFVIWQFTNPFWWLININNFSYGERGMGLFCFVVLECIALLHIPINKKPI